MKKEIIVVKEQAEIEFDGWAENADLDLDISKMDAEDLAAFNKQKGRIVKAIMYGNLTFNDDLDAVYTPFKPKSKTHDPITFQAPSGASLMAMDGKKNNQDVKKTFAIMADMCSTSIKTFSGLAGEDSKVVMAIFALLMD